MDEKTIEEYRKEFPVTRDHVYLDHAGIAPLSLRVKAAVEGYLREATGSGAFRYPSWATRVARVRESCAAFVGASADEIAFVRSTSHGLSLVARGLAWEQGDNVIYCDRDFPSNIYPWLALQERGVEARPVPLREGRVRPEDIAERLDGKTRLVAVSSVQFATGARVDMTRLGRFCGERGALLCVDAIQGLGVVPTDVRNERIDILAADSHKWLLGPEGIGIFFCRRGVAGSIAPALIGWKSVKNELDFDHPNYVLKEDAMRFEEGALNLMGIIALGAAIDLLAEAGIGRIAGRVQSLGDAIISQCDKRGFEVLTPRAREERGGGVSFRGGFDPVTMRERLRQNGIMVNARGGALRVSPHFYNTEEEIERLFREIDGLGR